MPEPRSVIVICTANQCRSPMAAAILRNYLNRMDPDTSWRVESARTWATPGVPATPQGVQVMAQRGLDTSQHRSRSISKGLLDQFQLILTMESGHKEAIQVEFPDLANRVFLLTEMAGHKVSIKDPIGEPFFKYQSTAREIDEWITRGLPKILENLNYPEIE